MSISRRAGTWSRPMVGFLLAVTVAPGLLSRRALADGAAAGGAGGEFYVFQGERRELKVDASRVAVLRAAEAAARAGGGVPELGVAPIDAETWPIAGWTLVKSAALAPALRARDAQAAAQREFTPRQLVAAAASAAEARDIAFVSPVFFDDLGGPMMVTPVLLVGFGPEVDAEGARELLAGKGEIEAADWANMPGVYRVRSVARDGFEVLDAANTLAETPGVRFAEPSMIFTGRSSLTPNDPNYASCWGIHNTGQFGGVADMDMDGPEAWDVTVGLSSIRVLIIDTGVDQGHPDLNLGPGADTTSDGGNGGPVNSFDNHGTAVAGCVSARINNGIGTVGIAPGTQSCSARTFITVNSQGNWTSDATWTVNALTFGESVGVRVTNNSNYYGFSSNAIANKYLTTRNAGMVHFASAGNEANPNNVTYPASLPDVNAVAAVGPQGTPASFTNGGPQLFIAAPGVTVASTDRQGPPGYAGGDYVFVDGTSFASPYAAGVAALILSFNPNLPAAQVESILATTAVDRGNPGFDNVYGFGFINAAAALGATPPPGLPQAFALLAPAQGAMQVARRPTFTWQQSLGATSYQIQVDDNSDFASPAISTAAGAGVYEHTGTPLAPATGYFWRVTATNSFGSRISTPAAGMFTTISVAPQSFALLAPSDGASGVPLTPSFSWQAAPLAESYVFMLDNNADFSSPLVNTPTLSTTFSVSAPLPSFTTFYWKVLAQNPIGSTPSPTGSFTTLLAPPAGFSLLAPADGAFVPTRRPTFTWAPSDGATSYQIIIDNDLSLQTPVVSESGLAGTSFVPPANVLADQTRYYWRVIGTNAAGSVESAPATATFAVIVPPCPGDANSDGEINFADIVAVLQFWGGTGPGGDSNRDGQVNFIDISNTLAFWGDSCR
ncbi:MAG: S8 family serine peptidase [Planctomycetota bacterium]|nr:S8 family serine peptidase [Planctomycetota bacterium]